MVAKTIEIIGNKTENNQCQIQNTISLQESLYPLPIRQYAK
jgi:hypothetical protein